MTFYEVLEQALALLQRHKRISYRALKLQFHLLGDDYLEALKDELIYQQVAEDEDGKGLVWTGEVRSLTPSMVDVPGPSAPAGLPLSLERTETRVSPDATLPPAQVTSIDASKDEPTTLAEPSRAAPEAERRQLTVMFCDLVDSTNLSGKLDPEDLHKLVRAYQETAAEVIQRYEGHIAQYLGDGLLIYFGFPVAHEDDAQRAVHSGLEIPQALGTLNTQLEADYGVELAVRIGIHTGPVVIGEIGSGNRHENLALGETPNIAARLEGLAPSNSAVLSSVTAQLVQRVFVLEELGDYALKGVAEPVKLFGVVGQRQIDEVRDSMLFRELESLVGRDEEIGLLRRRWEQSQEGLGQVVLISGDVGIGKSTLIDCLRSHVRRAGLTQIVYRCSPYHTNSALYPVITHLEHILGFEHGDDAATKLDKLEQGLRKSSLPLEELAPPLAALLSVPLEGRYPVSSLSPQQQRQQILDALNAWLGEEADRHPVLAVWEDMHWADPSTLEALAILIDQAPTMSILHVLTFRPEFSPPWPMRSHMTPITLNRLERSQIETLITQLLDGKSLPREVIEHIVTKTDGVPLYVEELTKMLVASDRMRQEADRFVLTGPLSSLAIPDTLQDSLMARLDQMHSAKEVAQLGAVLGREFHYDLIQAIASQDEEVLQDGLARLVESELLYQRGRPPRSRYIFKHALIQDTAYQSLLRGTRQRVHQQIAQQLEARFPEIVETQPEIMAHHYTEADCLEEAIGYWRQAGLRALQGSANLEAIHHLQQGLKLLEALPETSERPQQELDLQMTLGNAWGAGKGWGNPETGQIYSRARELAEQLNQTSHLIHALQGLGTYYFVRSDLQIAYELRQQCLALAEQARDPVGLAYAYYGYGTSLFWRGDVGEAYRSWERALAHADTEHVAPPAFFGLQNPWVDTRARGTWCLWLLGFPDQAVQRCEEAIRLAEQISYPLTQVTTLFCAARLHQFRRDGAATQRYANAIMSISTEHGFPHYMAQGTMLQGWFQVQEGHREAGIAQMGQGLADYRATGATLGGPFLLSLQAEAYSQAGRPEEGLALLEEAFELIDKYGERWWEAELHRLQGELRGMQSSAHEAEVETSFQQSLQVARTQESKSLELRTATSLAHLWQSQGKRQNAYDLLAPVYEWFTEGLDTADLVKAKELLEVLKE